MTKKKLAIGEELRIVLMRSTLEERLREVEQAQRKASDAALWIANWSRSRSVRRGKEWEKAGSVPMSLLGKSCSAWGDVSEVMRDVARGTVVDKHEWRVLNDALRLEKRLAKKK
jgi:hypothetical protein